jgi:hypothetical protein
MKYMFFFLNLLFSSFVFSHLYLTTEFFQDTEAKPIVTKHHIFLNQSYDIRYWKMSYTLKLVKVEGDKVTIESESYLLHPLKKEFLAGGIWSGKIGEVMSLKQYQKGKLKFKLDVRPTQIVHTPK